MHEPIIERAISEQVQQKRGKIRKRRTNDGERNMFSGLLACADCGHNFHFHFNQGNPEIRYFNLARDEELDGLFERIYEDNVAGKLSDDRFAKMSRRYEDEQKELAEKIKKLRAEPEKQSSRPMTTDMFISLIRKYTCARKLTPRMLNELIEKIEVFNAEKVDGVWEQRLRIHYNCVGEIEIPKVLPLPIPDVTVNTRKGVLVSYAPSEVAV